MCHNNSKYKWRIKHEIIMRSDDTVLVSDDGLPTPEVGPWAEAKHNVVSYYSRLFSTGMKKRWDKRVYVELYAGSGYSKIRDTTKTIMGSPLRALSLPDPFDKYVFCEEDPDLIKALELRAKRIAPTADVICIPGNCNERLSDIAREIPVASRAKTVLSLCFADPCDIGIKFNTIRFLAERAFIDFLVLLALYMDANRNNQNYVNPRSSKVSEFLGVPNWRSDWAKAEAEGVPFPKFLAEAFSKRMETQNYIYQPIYKMKEIMFPDKNWPLYRLALFSRNDRAYQFWDDVLKYSTDQTEFTWE
jgi:three-Cys-motif partner protein